MSALPRLHSRAHVFSGLTALMLCLAAAVAPAMAGVRTHALTLAGAVPALSTGFAHMPHVNPEARKGGTLRLGVIGGFDSLHPFIMRGIPAAQLGLTYETLGETVPGEDGVIYGLLAESFEESADGGHLVCHLAPAARFADGHPVTAADVVFSFEMLTRHGSPFYRDYYAGVGTVTAVDAHTVRFDFTSGHNAELPYIVAQLPVLPRHWWQGRDFTAPQAEGAPGSGPYRVREARPGSGITYERVPGWWGAKLPINRGRYNFDVIRCDYYRDTTVARQAFLAGEFDLWNENTIKDWFASYDVPAVREGRIAREEIPHGRPEGMGGFVFNTRRAIFADVRVRRALAMCFDFEWTNRALFHDAYRRYDSFFSNSPFAAAGIATEGERALLREVAPERAAILSGTPPQPATHDGSGDIRPVLRDALRLMHDAGWNLRGGRLVDASGRPFRFTLLLSSKGLERVVLPFRRNLSRLGVEMDVQVVDQTQYVSRVRAFDYDMVHATMRQSSNPGNEQRAFWTTAAADAPGSRNYAGVRDTAVDALVERIIAARDAATLRDAVHALDRVLLHGHYVVPGWYSDRQRMAYWKTRVAHPAFTPRGGIDLHSWWAVSGDDTQAKGVPAKPAQGDGTQADAARSTPATETR